jgi:cytochrome c-type biogenesis protein CcsB
MDISSFLDNLIFLNLLIITIFYWASLIYSNFSFLKQIGLYGNICANLLIFGLLGLRWLNYGYFPLSNLYESLMFLAWGITFITLVIQDRSKISLIGSLSTPIALFVTGFASLSLPESMQAPAPLVPALKSNWLMMHVTVMMLSYASLIIGSLLGIFFLFLYKSQKKNVTLKGNSYGTEFSANGITSTAFYQTLPLENYNNLLADIQIEEKVSQSEGRLNLLESIDNLSYRTISFGFPLLTIGIISGAVWANEAWGSYWSWDPKETWALITWLVFASYLHARITKSWQGEKPAFIASIGFVVVWICYLGVNFLGKGLHTYGQIF